MYDLYLGMISI